jgi:hypothetical protein
VLKPAAIAISFVGFDDLPMGDVASYEIEVRGEHQKTETPFVKPYVNIISHEGSYEQDSNMYAVRGEVENLEEREHAVEVWVGFYGDNGKLLDVNSIKLIVNAGEVESFWICSHTPEANKIVVYDVNLKYV